MHKNPKAKVTTGKVQWYRREQANRHSPKQKYRSFAATQIQRKLSVYLTKKVKKGGVKRGNVNIKNGELVRMREHWWLLGVCRLKRLNLWLLRSGFCDVARCDIRTVKSISQHVGVQLCMWKKIPFETQKKRKNRKSKAWVRSKWEVVVKTLSVYSQTKMEKAAL